MKLPSSEVHQILQDSMGFIWMATDAGICRYNGSTLKTFTVKDGMSENAIIKMKLDSKNRIWFLTVSGLFFYYENDHFTQISANAELKKKITHVICDFSISGDTLFYNLNQSEIVKITPQDNYGKLTILPFFPIYKKADFYTLEIPFEPRQLMTFRSNLHLNSDSTFTMYVVDTLIKLSSKGINLCARSCASASVRKASDGSIYSPANNKLFVIKNAKLKQGYVFPKEIYKVFFDKDGDLWIGTREDGAYLFKNGDLTNTPIHVLPSLSVTSILVDREGSVFISTEEKGVFICMNKYVHTIAGSVTDIKKYNNKLTALFAYRKQLTASEFDSIKLENIELLKNGKFRSFSKGRLGNYYEVNSNLLYKAKNQAPKTITFKPGNMPLSGSLLVELSNDTLLAVNSVMMATVLHSEIIREHRPAFQISFATRLPDKRILVSSRSEAGIFELKNDRFIPFLDHIKELKTRVNWITVDSSGNFWFATNEKGLYCYDTKKQLHVFNDSNGLISNKVNACIATPTGNIWCSTYFGLSKLSISKGIEKAEIENFDKNHGIVDLEIGKIAWFNNTIWCAGKSAFFFFEEDKMKKNFFPPGLYINAINIATKNFPLSDSLILEHNQNDFRVQYELISSKKIINPTFLYKLDGYDDNWRTSHSGDIQYTNIGYGTYTLLVYGVNNDGVKNNAPLKITFIIKKPFWFTWWFILLEIGIAYLILHLFFVFWKHKIEKREQEKTHVNQKIAEFKMTALRSQMNPHFIFNAIGSIQHFILANEAKQSYNYLAKFSMLIRNILNNSREEYISLSQEISTLQLYIELEQIRFTNPFKFIIDIDETIDMETYIPTMLIQPYIENSIWHGLMPKSSGGILELIIRKADDSLLVTIRDNGVGRTVKNTSQKHISKGMSITEQRIETLEATSQKKFNTRIIDLKDEYNNPIGTEVNLIIPFSE